MAAHTIIATPPYGCPLKISKFVFGWLVDAVNGNLKDYGVDLVDKQY